MKYLLPLAVQGLAIIVDEFHFRFARGLPRRERNLIVYIAAAAFSCFFVTNDEFVHADLCAPAGHLNYAVRFIAHPPVFAAPALLWPLYHGPAGAVAWLEHFRGLEYALRAQATAMALYLICQVVYRNLIRKAPATEFGALQ